MCKSNRRPIDPLTIKINSENDIAPITMPIIMDFFRVGTRLLSPRNRILEWSHSGYRRGP